MPGIEGEPLATLTRSGFMRPAWMKPVTVGEVANIICVSPASSDCAAGPPPLNCTEVTLIPAAASKAQEAICGAEPKPAEALNSLPGFAFAKAIRSASVWYGVALFTTSTVAPLATRETGTKSLSLYDRSL